MGEAKRKRERATAQDWPRDESFRGVVEMHQLGGVPELNGARIRELTGDPMIPDSSDILLRAFEARAGERRFHVGFCLGNENGVSAIGVAVIERLMMEASGAALHVVPIVHADIAWDLVLRNLRTFTGRVLLCMFPDSATYDAGVAELNYSTHIQLFGADGRALGRLTPAHRRRVRAQIAQMQNKPPPKFYEAEWVDQVEAPWIFRLRTPAGKEIRTAIWNGRRNYEHELPPEVARWVGGERIAIVQVQSPVGVNRRSSVDLTHKLSGDFDGVIHWARDTETFQSILNSFVRLDLESVSPPELPEDWMPDITILAAGGPPEEI
jgi:hypothetical protein